MMPRIRGKLAKGKNGSLEIDEDRIVIKEEKGLFSKRLEEIERIALSQATSTSIDEKQLPYRSMIRIQIEYQEGEESPEILFFSEDRGGLEAIKTEIDTDIERRRAAAEREEAARRMERESHVHHISLVLEMVDQVFHVLVSLHGEPRWDSMSRSVGEAERIVVEMEALGVVAPVTMDVRGLSSAVADRKADEIKEESTAILSVAHRDAERLAHYGGIESFDMELHEVFVKSYLLLWDIYLAESIGDPVDEDEIKALKETFSRLSRFTDSDASQIALQEMDRLSILDGVAPRFEGLRLLMLQCMESLIE
jgi:hypothetical protein